MGVPSPLKRLCFALTEVTKAAKLVTLPQCRATRGGDGFSLSALLFVGVQQANSFSTVVTTLVSWEAVASRNISSVSLHGSAPVNCGGPAFAAPVAGLRSHLAAFWMLTSLGLNWKLISSSF